MLIIIVVILAYSTIIAGYYYGESSLNYLIETSGTNLQTLINELRKSGCIESEVWLEDGVHITARATGRLLALISPFVVDGN